MKVTVSFGNVRVVVPCGRGHFLVSDLTEKAVTRYRKAICKPSDYWVNVHNLKSSTDGGILDPDDELSDVVDDRDQIIAIYDEQGAPPVPHNGGDGTSASSVGTSSPDIFQVGAPSDSRSFNGGMRGANQNDVYITCNDISTDCGLRVRRGSEPVLADITLLPKKLNTPPVRANNNDEDDEEVEIFPWQPSKQLLETSKSLQGEPPRLPLRLGGSGREKSSSPEGSNTSNGRFSRDAARRSLANNGNLFRWLEAQQNQQEAFERQSRKEPLGGPGRTEDDDTTMSVVSTEPGSSIASRDNSIVVCLKNTKEPLGIHVVPDYDRHGRDMGLVIQGIEEGRRIDKDGRLQTHDRIIEINNTSLLDLDFNKAQDVFKAALQSDEIQLRVLQNRIPPPLPTQPPPDTPDVPELDLSRTSSGPPSPTKRVPPAVPARHPSTTLSEPASPEITVAAAAAPSPKKAPIIAPTNTRKMGKQISIDLLKGSPGLGFSVTTRDNPAGGVCPIYIKNILPGGAAIGDGRLRIGDRLLKVNGVDLADKTQKDAVALLKKAKMGSFVNLVVSRQVTDDDGKSSPSKSGSEVSPCSSPGAASEGRETIHVDIPLSDSGSAALGISVKSKTRDGPRGPEDLGVFIKSVLAGGAAARDGRLRPNDRLLSVNGCSLQHLDNETAMRHLRDSMTTTPDDPSIKITVSRRVAAPGTTPAVPPVRCREIKVSRSDVPEEEIPDGVDITRASDRRLLKLRGESSPTGLRNTSYQQANHDSAFETPIRKVTNDKVKVEESPSNKEGYITKRSETAKARPSSTIGFLHPPTPDSGTMAASRSSELLNQTGAPSPPEWLTKWEKAQEGKDEDEEEDLGDGENPFKREGFGRQSMSEKRKKADLDPRLMEFYQKVKEVKQSKGDTNAFYSEASNEPVGPTLGLRKSSSLESLQSVIQEASMDDNDGNATGAALWRHPNRGIVRGRGCNESFRAAVDHSYDDTGGAGDASTGVGGEIMEALEEESSEVGSADQGHSRVSSFSGSDAASEDGRKQKKTIKEKEKGKLLKGLGSMFRFGRHRKPLEDRAPKQSAVDMHNLRAPEQSRDAGREPSRESHREAGRNPKAEKTKKTENVKNTADKPQKTKNRDAPTDGMSRIERIQQLRADHQRRHLERHRQYPHDDGDDDLDEERRARQQREDIAGYERQMAEWEKKLRQQYGEYAVPPRRRAPEAYERWRSASAMSASPDHYGHYQNLDQIQESLRLHDYYRQQYHNYMQQQQQQQQQQWQQARRAPYPQMRDHHAAAEWLSPELSAYRPPPPPPPPEWAHRRETQPNGGQQFSAMPLGGHMVGHSSRLVSVPPQMHYQQRAAPPPTAGFVYDRHGPHYASLPRQYSEASRENRHITTTSAQV